MLSQGYIIAIGCKECSILQYEVDVDGDVTDFWLEGNYQVG